MYIVEVKLLIHTGNTVLVPGILYVPHAGPNILHSACYVPTDLTAVQQVQDTDEY